VYTPDPPPNRPPPVDVLEWAMALAMAAVAVIMALGMRR